MNKMEKPTKTASAIGKKRKRKSSTKITASEPKTIKLEEKNDNFIKLKKGTTTKNAKVEKGNLPKVMFGGLTKEEISAKYPVLQDKELVAKFLKVPFTNNQKGRIRQAVMLQLKNSNDHLNPDAIHGKIQAILKSSNDLTDSELRRIRILYNILNTTVSKPQEIKEIAEKIEKAKKKKEEKKALTKENEEGIKEEKEVKKKLKKDKEIKKEDSENLKEGKEQLVQKVKGPKRYVVFLGNLPLGIDKEKIMEHFSEFRDRVKDVRVPTQSEDKKSAIAFVELQDESTYELALSKHHSMLGNKRINVLYSTQKNSKISKAEAKSKSAKLIALQKSGKLLGSVPLAKKRSQRRLKKKKAQAKQADSA